MFRDFVDVGIQSYAEIGLLLPDLFYDMLAGHN